MSVFKVSFVGTPVGEHKGKPSKVRFKVESKEDEEYNFGKEEEIEYSIHLQYKDVTDLKITEVYK